MGQHPRVLACSKISGCFLQLLPFQGKFKNELRLLPCWAATQGAKLRWSCRTISAGIQLCPGFVVTVGLLLITSPCCNLLVGRGWLCLVKMDVLGGGWRCCCHLWLYLFFLIISALSSSNFGNMCQMTCWFSLFFRLGSLLKSPEQQMCSGVCHPSMVAVLSLMFCWVLSCLMI